MNVDSAVVKMEPGQDLRLHHDFINITMVCQLDGNSEGGEFYFEKYGEKINLKQGHLYIFPGQITHRYGIRLVKNEPKYFIKSYCNAS
jgi:predicted 2-oxoglutarate/Fe(II)-dependent dioxygenase YbiX